MWRWPEMAAITSIFSNRIKLSLHSLFSVGRKFASFNTKNVLETGISVRRTSWKPASSSSSSSKGKTSSIFSISTIRLHSFNRLHPDNTDRSLKHKPKFFTFCILYQYLGNALKLSRRGQRATRAAKLFGSKTTAEKRSSFFMQRSRSAIVACMSG